MELINSTHIAKHCSVYAANRIINMLRPRISTVSKYGYSKIARASGVVYYTKVLSTFVDVEEAIKGFEDSLADPYYRFKEFDYQKHIDILELVLADRIEFGDKIPDTTDVWGELWRGSSINQNPRNTRVQRVASRKAKKEKFLEKFSDAKIKWS